MCPWRRCWRGEAGWLRLALSCPGRSIHFAVAGAQPICIIFEPLLRITQNLVCGLDGLEFRIEFQFPPRVPVRVILEG